MPKGMMLPKGLNDDDYFIAVKKRSSAELRIALMAGKWQSSTRLTLASVRN